MSELRHFGVRGMKWGVRKKREPHSESSRRFDKRKAWELSDAELNRRINRINKERQYSDMTASRSTKWRKAGVKALIGVVGGLTIIALRHKLSPSMDKIVSNGVDYVSKHASSAYSSVKNSEFVSNMNSIGNSVRDIAVAKFKG